MPQTINHETRSIPLSALVPSPHNVRARTEDDLAALRKTAEVRQMANSIAHNGLLQSLIVHPIDGDAKHFGVAGGGRRLAALTLLRAEKKVPASHEVACTIVPESEALQCSLSENVDRAAMHPAQEYVAFVRLIESGKSIEDVAAAFGVTPLVVKRRLKLGNVAPEILELYKGDKMSLESVMAFTINPDHGSQLAVLNSLKGYEKDNAHTIRARLTEAGLSTDHKLVKFVGLKAIRKNGGIVQEDVFSSDRAGYVTDGDLVRLMSLTKLEEIAAQLREEEGHAWSEARNDFDYSDLSTYDRAPMVRGKPTAEQKERIATLKAEAKELEAITSGEDENAADKASERLDAIIEEQQEIENSLQKPLKAAAKLCGVVVTVKYNGELEVHRGLVKPEDKKQLRAIMKAKAAKAGGSADAPAAQEDEPEGYSNALLHDLSCHYTAALRVRVAETNGVAIRVLAAALYKYAGGYVRGGSDSPVKASGQRANIEAAAGVEASRAATEWKAKQDFWKEYFTAQPDFFGAVLAMEDNQVTELLAFCAGSFVEAIGSRRYSGANRTAAAVGLDMRDFWSATPEAFLKRVPKGVILEAMREAAPGKDLGDLTSAKKGEVVEAAAPVLAEARWLPPFLRAASESDLAPEPNDAEDFDDDYDTEGDDDNDE